MTKSMYLTFDNEEFKLLMKTKDKLNKERLDNKLKALNWENLILLMNKTFIELQRGNK